MPPANSNKKAKRRTASALPSPPAMKRVKKKDFPLTELQRLGRELLSSRAYLNHLPVLLSHLTPSAGVDAVLEVLLSLQSFFVPLLSEIPGKGESVSKDDPESVFHGWLRDRFDEFIAILVDIAVSKDWDEALKEVALDAIMDIAKLGKAGRFQSAVYHKLLYSAVYAANHVDLLLQLLESKYFKYADVCYFTYTSVGKIARSLKLTRVPDSDGSLEDGTEAIPQSRDDIAIRHIYAILSHNHLMDFGTESCSMWSESGLKLKSEKETKKHSSSDHIIKRIKLKFTKAWMSFLKLPLPIDVYKEVLAVLHQNVIPSMSNPVILCDFLTRSYDIGGVISVMALSGLFILMTRHGLEYPKFYEKLYALLTPSVFIAKHRAVFFQLLDTCLKSSYLPAYLAAAFTKKLSRLALSVPPSGALIIIALVHNLLRRHPSINFLVNRIIGEEENTNMPEDGSQSNGDEVPHEAPMQIGKFTDPFNFMEGDPVKSNAMTSSLWEIETLRHHYLPAVSRFVTSLENDLTVRSKTTEMKIADFSSASYATVFGDEVRRRIKQVPLAFYRTTPTSLFDESDFPGWSFGDQVVADKENSATPLSNNQHGSETTTVV